MRYYVLQSGSKGNSTIIVSQGHYLVIDNGLSQRKFKELISQINVSLEDLNTILITHSHSDHIDGINVFDPRHVYASNLTFVALTNENKKGKVNKFKDLDIEPTHILIPYNQYRLNTFVVTVLPTSHDCKGSLGFVIEADGEKLVYITDTGYIYEKAIDYIKDADYYIFEANHDIRMQLKTGRPQYLIDRIMGDYGHMSNEDSALYLSEAITSRTKEIVLAHLSEEANMPELALLAFNKIMLKRGVDVSRINVRCASQKEMTRGGLIEKEFCYD